MNIAVFDSKSYDEQAFAAYQGKNDIFFKFYESRLQCDTVNLAQGFDGVCVFVNDVVNSVVIDRLCEYGCKFVLLRCAGFNNVDIAYAEGKIRVLRVPAYSPYSVAEHAMAMLLTLNRRIHKAYIRTRDYNFSLEGLMGVNLHGRTIGIVGAGKIGRALISICEGFGMKVLVYDRYIGDIIGKSERTAFTTLDKLIEESDFISLHCPLTEETRHMIDKAAMDRMKDGAVIINTSRGALINAEDLVNGLKSGKIGGACLDVYEEEAGIFYEDKSGYILKDDVLARLISMPNVIVTSHQAFLTREALDNIAETTFGNAETARAGLESGNEVIIQNGKA